MPWSKAHKEATHRRIVATAAAALRRQGLAGIGVAELMREAGLTHGGFYAHFPSKDALIAEALAHAGEQSRQWYGAVAATASAEGKLQKIVDLYLTPHHCAHPEQGCAVAALGGEVARAGGAARDALRQRIEEQLDLLGRYAPGVDRKARERQAIGAFAAMIGGLILARGLGAGRDSEHILAEVRAFLRDALAPPPKRQRARRG
jgi:TetR/AcrR family transcriptional repressor of nem operon